MKQTKLLSAETAWIITDYFKKSDKSDDKLKHIRNLIDILLKQICDVSNRRQIKGCPYRASIRLSSLAMFEGIIPKSSLTECILTAIYDDFLSEALESLFLA